MRKEQRGGKTRERPGRAARNVQRINFALGAFSEFISLSFLSLLLSFLPSPTSPLTPSGKFGCMFYVKTQGLESPTSNIPYVLLCFILKDEYEAKDQHFHFFISAIYIWIWNTAQKILFKQ